MGQYVRNGGFAYIPPTHRTQIAVFLFRVLDESVQFQRQTLETWHPDDLRLAKEILLTFSVPCDSLKAIIQSVEADRDARANQKVTRKIVRLKRNKDA